MPYLGFAIKNKVLTDEIIPNKAGKCIEAAGKYYQMDQPWDDW